MTHPDAAPSRPTPASLGVTAARAIVAARRPVLPAPIGYSLAVLATALATGLTVLLNPYLTRTAFLFFWPVVFGVAATAGIGPAIVASLLSVMAVDYFVIPPLHSFEWTETSDWVSSILFIFASLVIGKLADGRRRAEERAATAAQTNAELAQQLEVQTMELEQQLEEAQVISEELEQATAEVETERRLAENAATFTRGIIESITDPFVVHNAEWRFVYINSAAGRQFYRSGHASDPNGQSLIGKVLWDAYPDIVGTDFEREMRRAATTRLPAQFEAFYAQTGRWTQLSCYPLHDGGVATQWKDITARRKAEEATRYLDRAAQLLTTPLEMNERLQRLAALVVPDFADWCGIHLVDEDGKPKQVAVAHIDADKIRLAYEFEKKYPPNLDDAMGMPNVLRTGQAELIPEITDEMIVAGARDEEHLRLTRELGLRSAMVVPLSVREETFGVLTMVSAESRRLYTREDLGLASELARRAAYSIDNARQHQAAVEAQHQAEEANRAKSQFLASMSHELRTPLNAIAGYIDLILMGIRGAITEEQKSDLERVRSAQRHLLGLISDVLDFSRIEAGRVTVHESRVSVAPLLIEVVRLLEPQMRARAQKLTFNDPDANVAVVGDPDRIRQIVLNLLTNAIKYTGEGGSVTVTCESKANRVLIHVADTGVGIPADEVERIFLPFVQANRTLSSGVAGVGLGLAISRELARAMNGDLAVRTVVDEGSTFTLDLPSA
jgi:signal transduction histidine kinase/PAS domain-containing protein